ncbi:MAG: bifunctional oligoribonuclease/PAP phosphatase NrnA [Patescibacteria group bacterium]|nr:bifunctional oligoribonuclease/PAP phosphatase NrnA [Patescibacteria group bacterium]
MANFEQQYREFRRAYGEAQKILVIAHKKPDGDTLGACLAIDSLLQGLKKDVTLACIDKPVKRYDFLEGVNKFVRDFDYEEYDLIIVCDAGAHYMTGYHEIYPEIFSGKDVPVVNIDHHSSNDYFGTINIVDSDAASTTLILYRYFAWLDLSIITPEVATDLLIGIYNDTGSLMHSNTTREIFEVSADLAKKGAKSFVISKHLFKNTPLSTLKLWGRVFSNVKVNEDGVAMSVVCEKDFEECGANQDELSGVVDMVNAIPGIKFAVILNEDGQGNVKGSFRTPREDVDLSEIAGVFGGGGHRKAAGFSMPGKVEKEVRWKIVSDESLTDVSKKLLGEGNVEKS